MHTYNNRSSFFSNFIEGAEIHVQKHRSTIIMKIKYCLILLYYIVVLLCYLHAYGEQTQFKY